jgi:hypothetical protein
MERIRKFLEQDGFIVSEEEATFMVRYDNGSAEKIKNWSRFWSMKFPLRNGYPPYYFLVIQGEIRAEEKGDSRVDLEIIEYHASREHSYGGASSIVEYFDKFCKIFEQTSSSNPK